MQVVVLMSTYNGERFIEEQVASILAQLPPMGLLMVRDDGSTDTTAKKIYAFKDERILLEEGRNIGFAKSFLTLLKNTPKNTQMVMFSDQDDVWLEGKVQRAWDCLSTLEDRPALYCSRQMIADQDLHIVEESTKKNSHPSFHNSLAENIVTGCTAAINERAIDLMKLAGVPERVEFHDWWLYLVISAHGTVIADDRALILYRQHENNFIGRGTGLAGRFQKNIEFVIKNDWVNALIGQIQELRENYWFSLTIGNKKIIEKYVEFSGDQSCAQWEFIFSRRRWIEDPFRDLIFRCLLLIHRVKKKARNFRLSFY